MLRTLSHTHTNTRHTSHLQLDNSETFLKRRQATLFNSNKDSPWQFISLLAKETRTRKKAFVFIWIYSNFKCLFHFIRFLNCVISLLSLFSLLRTWFHSDPLFCVTSLYHLDVCRFEWIIMEQHSSSSCQFILTFLLTIPFESKSTIVICLLFTISDLKI